MHSTRGISRIPSARQPHKQPSITTSQRSKRQSIIPTASNLLEGPDYGVRQADISQLLIFLRQIGLHATEEDLMKPNPIRVRQLFEVVLQYFVPYRIDFLLAQKQRAAAAFEDSPELGVEIVEAVPIFKEMQHFLKRIRFSDIKLTDVLSPTPDRLQRILSALLNYSLFSDSAFENFKSLAQEAMNLTSQYENLQTEKETWSIKITQLESQTELERSEIQEWEAKIEEDEQTLKILRKEGDTIVKDIEFYKTERHQLKDILQELQYTMLNALEFARQLKQYENWDINEIKKQIADLDISIKKDSEELQSLDQEYPQLEIIITETKNLSNNLSRWIQTMENVNNIRGDSSRHKKTNEALKKDQFSSTVLQKDLVNKISNVSRFLAVQDTRLQLLLDQREKKRESMDQYFKDFDQKKKIVHQEVEAASIEKSKCNLQIKEIQDKCNAAFAEHKSSVEALRSQIKRLFDIINDTHAKSLSMKSARSN